MHIPKTAGTTLRLILEKKYKDNIFRNYDHYPVKATIIEKNIKCVTGHQPFNFYDFEERPHTYITLLRDPVDRVISEYYYLLVSPRHDIYIADMIYQRNMTLKDYVLCEDPVFLQKTRNLQARYVTEGNTPTFEKAKKNLENHFCVVGVTDEFENSLCLMEQKLGWSEVKSFQNDEVNITRPPKESIPKDITALIRENNSIDNQLYHWAKKRIKKELISFKRGDKD